MIKSNRVWVRVGVLASTAVLALSSAACVRTEPAPAPTVAPPAPAPTTAAPVPTENPLPPTTEAPTPTDEPTPVNTCSTDGPPITASTPEGKFVQVVRRCSAFDQIPDAQVVRLGTAVCGAFDRNATFEQVLDVMLRNDFPAYESGWLIAGAVLTMCPQHRDKLPDDSAVGV